MGRMGQIFARPSAWLGIVGFVLFLVALGWTSYDSLVPATAARCPELKASGPSDRLRILDIGSAELQLRGGVCLIVDNVVSETALRGRQANAALARSDLARADQAAAIPAPAPAAASRYGYSYRLRRYVALPVVVPAAAPAATNVAKAGRDAAAARLADANAELAQLTAPRRLVLFLNGERSPASPRTVRGDAAPQAVTFDLAADADASGSGAAYWRTLMGRRSEAGLVPVTLGVAEEAQAIPAATLRVTPVRNGGTSEPLGFRVFRPAILWLAGIGLALMLVGLAGTARATALLRDGRSRYSSYSLARVQMAWWFALTVAGFVYIWLVTGQFLGVVGSATFVLLGIAGATAGAARVVARPGAAAEKELTRGFLTDLAGGERIELHRLQMIAWTIVLGAIYAYNILANFTLTQFDANLLALAGVVNGVYVGLKTQEG